MKNIRKEALLPLVTDKRSYKYLHIGLPIKNPILRERYIPYIAFEAPILLKVS